jgi:hypothetical protein
MRYDLRRGFENASQFDPGDSQAEAQHWVPDIVSVSGL